MEASMYCGLADWQWVKLWSGWVLFWEWYPCISRISEEKYKTLDALNEAWGTIVWNQTYTNWKEIYVPRTTVHDSTNPHQVLDYYRFISDSTLRFCKMQSDIIRKYKKPEDFITTNGILEILTIKADGVGCRLYHVWQLSKLCLCYGSSDGGEGDLKDRNSSFNLARTRAISPLFGIMEQQSGANGWNTRMEAPAPNRADDIVDNAEHRTWCWLCQLFPLAYRYRGNRNLLAWHSGLRQSL